MSAPFSLRCLGAVLWVAALPLAAAEPSAGGGRELSGDRPDATETPTTIDAGRVQLEASVASWTRDRQQGVKTTEWEVAPFNVRIGVTPRTELGLFVTPEVRRTEQLRNGPKTTMRGFGDTVLRGKLNFWGNDGGATAFGAILDVKLPTAADGVGNDKVEPALTLPVTFEIGAGWEGAAMTSVERAYGDDGRYAAVWTNTFSAARDLTKSVGMFLELASTTGTGRHVLLFDCGLTKKIGTDLQLDVGANIGVSSTAPDLGVFAGFTRRF